MPKKSHRAKEAAAAKEAADQKLAKQEAQDKLAREAKRTHARDAPITRRTPPDFKGRSAPGHATMFEEGEKDYLETPPTPKGFNG